MREGDILFLLLQFVWIFVCFDSCIGYYCYFCIANNTKKIP